MVTHSTVLAWRIPVTEEPCGLQSIRSQRVKHKRNSAQCKVDADEPRLPSLIPFQWHTRTHSHETHSQGFLRSRGGKGKEKGGSNRGGAFPSALAFSTQAKLSWTERGSILLMEKSLVPMALDAALECLRNTKKRLNFQRDFIQFSNWRLMFNKSGNLANLLFNFSPLKGSIAV